MTNVLFVCSANVDRSPTAEEMFRDHPGIAVASAGTLPDAVRPLNADHIAWADIILVMEDAHREAIAARFGETPKIVVLGIPDDYRRGDAELVTLLQARVPRLLSSM
ncbi:MAG: phosphotyrosine protein phosphatase [Hyphomicrobiaceae bacterium]